MDIRIKKQIRARRQFKALVRLVIANREWLIERKSIDMTARVSDKTQRYSKPRHHSLLELKHIALLNKKAADRTEEEKMLIYKIIGGFKCFRKYPEHVKMLLAGCTYFAYFGPDRVIVRQHHPAEALYFIIKGEVSMTAKNIDRFTNQEVDSELGAMEAGNVFGEDSLLNHIPRQMTITTNTSVEFLLLYREDFDLILRDSMKQEWDYITNAMKSFTYFDSWDDIAIMECCTIAKIKTYEKDDTILGDGKGNKNWVYFVLKGKCSVIEHLYVEPQLTDNSDTFKLHNANLLENKRLLNKRLTIYKSRSITMSRGAMYNARSKLSTMSIDDDEVGGGGSLYSFAASKVTTIFMQVCIFNPKACFGLGETMDRRRIVALEPVECLVIPRYFILARGQNNIWSRIQFYLDQHIPSTQEVFYEFQEQRKWRKIKDDLVDRIPKVPCNVAQNVPYTIRLRQDYKYEYDY